MKTFYHVTLLENWKSIKENGLIPKIGELSKLIDETQKRIYLFPNIEDMENALYNWLGETINDLYGEDNSIWNNFKNSDNNINNTSFKEILSLFKGIDLKTIQKALTSLNKAIDVFKDFHNEEKVNNYEERPKYKYFED